MSVSVFGVKVGDKVSFTKTVSEDDIIAFAEVTGDKNPLHLDDSYAAKTRFKERIAHGMLSAGYISAALGTRLAPNSTVIYISQDLRFRRPVKIGDTITATCEVTDLQPDRRFATVKTTCINQASEEVLLGEATVLLDEMRD